VKQALSDISKVSVQDNSPDIYSTITFGSPSQDSLAGQSYFENDGYGFGGSSVSMSNNSLSGTGTDSRPSGKKKGRRGEGGARRVSYLQEGRGGGGTGQGLSSGLSNDPEIGLQASMEVGYAIYTPLLLILSDSLVVIRITFEFVFLLFLINEILSYFVLLC